MNNILEISHERRKYFLWLITGFAIIISCRAFSAPSDGWREFLKRVGVERDKILCEGDQEGDYFLIARLNDRLLAVYRVDITGENGRAAPFVISWSFTDENDSSLDASTPPDTLIKEITKAGGRSYVENAGYRTLLFEKVKSVRVRIGMKKSNREIELSSDGRYNFNQLITIPLCELPVQMLR